MAGEGGGSDLANWRNFPGLISMNSDVLVDADELIGWGGEGPGVNWGVSPWWSLLFDRMLADPALLVAGLPVSKETP